MNRPTNLIVVLARGDQEMFHSAFIAWLLDDTQAHGMGTRFRSELLGRLDMTLPFATDRLVEVLREHSDGRLRFDILLQPADGSHRGLVFENKTKSVGHISQLLAYADAGYAVAWLGLVPESFDQASRDRFPGIDYRAVRESLAAVRGEADGGYAFIIAEYEAFIEASVAMFDGVRSFSAGDIELAEFVTLMCAASSQLALRDNDVRSLSHFWYYGLAEFLQRHQPVAAHALSRPEGPFRTGWMMARERETITELDLPRSRPMM